MPPKAPAPDVVQCAQSWLCRSATAKLRTLENATANCINGAAGAVTGLQRRHSAHGCAQYTLKIAPRWKALLGAAPRWMQQRRPATPPPRWSAERNETYSRPRPRGLPGQRPVGAAKPPGRAVRCPPFPSCISAASAARPDQHNAPPEAERADHGADATGTWPMVCCA